jgi:hypothetical protein
MYVTAREYLGLKPKNTLGTDVIPSYFSNKPTPLPKPTLNEFKVNEPLVNKLREDKAKPIEDKLEKKWEKIEGSTTDPRIWGPAFWFTLHVTAAHYPENPSPIVRHLMKNRILAIPYEIPCSKCRSHAIAFIDNNKEKLDDIVSNKHKLGKFYVEFHNNVNMRYGKPIWDYEKAYKLYSGNAKINIMK